jgi:hypothetical protein
MSTALRTEHWYDDDGVKLTVTCDDQSCLAELLVPSMDERQINVEILQRSRDSRGVAIGPSVTVFHQNVNLQSLCEGAQSIARFWLPRAVSKRLRECFFRIRRPAPKD